MQTLLAGYQRFRSRAWPAQQALFADLAAHGQHPKSLVVGCVDSRVEPAMIFDIAPGEVLTVRNVANLVPPYGPDSASHGTSAALEFGVKVLGVSQIIILGHGSCGGVKALLDGVPENAGDFIAPWMSVAESARVAAGAAAAGEARQRCCEHEVVKLSLANLLTFPFIADAVKAGRLALFGAWFGIDSGTLMVLRDDGHFVPAEEWSGAEA